MLTTVAEANTAIGRQPGFAIPNTVVASRSPFSENSKPIDTNAKIKNQVRRPHSEFPGHGCDQRELKI